MSLGFQPQYSKSIFLKCNPKTPIYSVRTYYIDGPKSDPKWQIGEPSQDRLMARRCAQYSVRNPVPRLCCGGTLGGLQTIAQSTWRFANGLYLAQWASYPFIAPWASWRSWNTRQGCLASGRCGSQLAEWSTPSIAPPRLVSPPTL